MVAFAATVFATPAPAGAHAFGDPQIVAMALDLDHPRSYRPVEGRRRRRPDLLGVALGLLPQDRIALDGAVSFRESDAAAIGPSDRFAAYLLKQIMSPSADERVLAPSSRRPTWPRPA